MAAIVSLLKLIFFIRVVSQWKFMLIIYLVCVCILKLIALAFSKELAF